MLHVIVVRHDGSIAQQSVNTNECVSVSTELARIGADPEIKAALLEAHKVIRIYDSHITVDTPDFFKYLAGGSKRRPNMKAGANHCIRIH